MQGFVLRLGHDEEDEHSSKEAIHREGTKRDAHAECFLDVIVRFDDDKLNERAQDANDSQRESFHIRREEFSHHDTGNGTETNAEHCDVDGETCERQETETVDVFRPQLLEVEVITESSKTDGHANIREEQQWSPPRSVHEEGREECHDHLNDPYNVLAIVGINGNRIGLLEDCLEIEDDYVNSGKGQEA